MKKSLFILALFAILGLSTAFAQITVTDSASVNTVCQGSSTTLTAYGATSYLWCCGLGTANPLIVTPTSTTTYTVTGTSVGGTGTASITITVNPNPTITVTSTDEYCGLYNGTATATPSGVCISGFTYYWNSSPVQSTQTATNLPAGTYTVSVSCDGCIGTASTTITNIPGTAVFITNITNASCIGSNNGSATDSLSGGTPPYNFHWSNGENTIPAIVLSVGTYTVTVTDANGCTSSASCTIGANDSTLSYFIIYPDTSILHHYFIVNDASGGVLPYTYYWSWGDGTHDTIAYPSHTYAASGFYNICLTVTDFTGCSNTYCDSTYLLRSSSSMVSVTVIHSATGIIEDELSNQINIYPNPVTNNLTIESPQQAIVEILNIEGQLIETLATTGNKTNIDVSALAKGMYFVKVKTEKGVAVKKFIKE